MNTKIIFLDVNPKEEQITDLVILINNSEIEDANDLHGIKLI